MSLATKILKYNQNIEESMFRPMPSVINKPLTEAQLRRFENFSAIGTIKEVNLLSDLQLSQILKDNNIILPVGVSPSSAEAMIYIQQRLGELSQGRERTLTLNDLIGIQQQSGEKLQVKLENVGKQLETMNDMLAPAGKVEGQSEQKENTEHPQVKEFFQSLSPEDTPYLRRRYDTIRNLTKKDISDYYKKKGLGRIPSKVQQQRKELLTLWVLEQELKSQK